MFTDIAGYTALMGESESKAYQLLKKNRQVQKPLIEKRGGKWLKEMGDGVLASFPTVTDAVYCAIEIQRNCQDEVDLKLRIGIHLGEVIVEEGDVFGDGVNIASRIEPLAPVGGICVSESVFRNIENKEGINVRFVGEETLKNVKRAVNIYEVDVDGSLVLDTGAVDKVKNKPHAFNWLKFAVLVLIIAISTVIAYLVFHEVEEKQNGKEVTGTAEKERSIAVLPFKNWSGDPDMEHFCYAMTDAVITRLTKVSGITKVITMTSAMAFKDTQKTSPEIAEELDVSHILEANFQKSGDLVKITLQLIDGPTENHFWAEEYTGTWSTGKFKLQAEVAESVARRIGAPLTEADIESIHSVHPAERTQNQEAYEYFLTARMMLEWGAAKPAFRELLEKAISLDPDFVAPYAWLGLYWMTQIAWNSTSYDLAHLEWAREYIMEAISRDDSYGLSYLVLGEIKLFHDWEFKEARELMMKAYTLDPVSINRNTLTNTILPAMGEYQLAKKIATEALNSSPYEAGTWIGKGLSEYFMGEYDDSRETFETGLARFNDGGLIKDASRVYSGMGEYDRMIDILDEYLAENPNLRPPSALGYMAIACYHKGKIARVDELINELKGKAEQSPLGSPSFYLSLVYAQMGDVDAAFQWLEKAYNDHEVEMYWIKVEPPFDPIRSDPRFKAMLDKVGFPN